MLDKEQIDSWDEDPRSSYFQDKVLNSNTPFAVVGGIPDIKQEGLKFDTGKLPYHLLPKEMMEGVAAVLDFGAKKYTMEYETEWDRLLDVPSVKELKLITPTKCVVVVTKKNSEELILNSQNDKDKIVGIGRNEIQTRLRNTPNVGRMIQLVEKEIDELSGLKDYKISDLQKSYTKILGSPVVKYVDRPSTLILTIVTRQGNLEVCCVPDATMDLASWEMMWKDLNKLFGISKPQDKTGQRNWELGMDWSRPFSALQRHMWAWWSGQDRDEETGMSHLWHAGCCLAFLIAYEQRQVGKDDRPK